MEVYQGVAMTDGLNRKNHFIPLSTILKAYRDTWDRTIPMNIGHDRTKPIGYTRLTGVYMEPGKAYVTNEGAIMETTEEHEMLRKMIEVNDYQQFCEAHRDEIDSLVGKLKDVITDSFRVAPIGQAVAIKDNDIVKRLFPEWINNFKDGLTDINELESVYSTTTDGEKGVLIPGVYFKDGYLLFAHQFFRRTLSILNSTNEEFFVSFEKLRDIPNLNVKVALDMDMVGLPGTEHPEIEYQYIRGPYFSEDLKLIPEGVTCYENEHYDNLFSNIVGTQFYWHKQDGTRTFECEELCDRENVSFDGGNTMLWGCRYVHSMLNPSTGLPTHLDGAIRLYNEENILERIDKKNDIVLLGAICGNTTTSPWYKLEPSLRPEAGLLKIRKELGLFANLRPAYLYDELKGACPLKEELTEGGFDMIIMRELTGGLYFGERSTEKEGDQMVARDSMSYSESEIRRIAKRGFDIAMKRNKKVTSVDKANVLDTSRLWRKVVEEVAKEYPEVTLEHMLVDNCAMQLVRDPKQFDVILTENMFGDILSDEASMVTGSIGMLSSASLREDSFGMYEPSHGSAPDIAGQNIANPIATILSAAMMLRYSFDLDQEAKDVEDAIEKVLKEGYRTTDIMSEGKTLVGTREMGDLIVSHL